MEVQPLMSLEEAPVGANFAIEDKEVYLKMTARDFKMSHSAINIELPESIYGAAMMAIIRSSQTYRGVVHGVTACIFGGLVLNVFAQFYVLLCTKMYICDPAVLKVRNLYKDYEQSVFPGGVFFQAGWDNFDQTDTVCQMPLSQPSFFIAILAIWTGTCWADLLESFTGVMLWLGLPSCPGTQSTVLEDAGENGIVLTHANAFTKAIAVIFISIPKIVIAIFCWWLGARWLLSTTNFQDLFLNGVALAFVTELDELVYLALIPNDIKEMVRGFRISMPPKIVKADARTSQHEVDLRNFVAYRDRRLAFMIIRMASTALVVVGLPVVYMRYLQQVLPGYRWDVHVHCERYIQEMTQGM